MTKRELIDWLVAWRQKVKGSISPHNHRRLLMTRTKRELLAMHERIVSREPSPAPNPEGK